MDHWHWKRPVAQTKTSRKESSLEAPGYIYIPLGYSQVAGCVSSGVSFDRCVSNLRLRALHLMIGQLVQYLNDLLPCARYIGLYWPLLVRGMINLKTWEVSLAG